MSSGTDGPPMSDGERDAWLREALRHAPDADAAPPRDLSETILAQARAAARGGATARGTHRRHPALALWDWLARPPVAAGFASVMVATLVGLMWWDRPMDETLPRPEVAAGRAPAGTATAPAPQASVDAIAPPAQARLQSDEGATGSDDKVAAAKLPSPAARMQAPPANAAAAEAKPPERKLEAANDALADRAAAKPSPFPQSDDARSAAARKKDRDARDDKALDRTVEERAGDALAARDAHAKSLPAPAPAATPPAEVLRAEPPAAFAGQRANETAQTSAAADAGSEAATRAAAAGAMSQAMPATAAEQARRNLGSRQREGAGATPLAPILAAIANDPSWSRATAAGNIVALDAGWRDWLAQLDAAARDRWQAAGAADERERERDGATTLRLVAGGRNAAVVRLDGTTVRVDAIDGGRWQATLPPTAAEQLRAAAERLGR